MEIRLYNRWMTGVFPNQKGFLTERSLTPLHKVNLADLPFFVPLVPTGLILLFAVIIFGGFRLHWTLLSLFSLVLLLRSSSVFFWNFRKIMIRLVLLRVFGRHSQIYTFHIEMGFQRKFALHSLPLLKCCTLTSLALSLLWNHRTSQLFQGEVVFLEVAWRGAIGVRFVGVFGQIRWLASQPVFVLVCLRKEPTFLRKFIFGGR